MMVADGDHVGTHRRRGGQLGQGGLLAGPGSDDLRVLGFQVLGELVDGHKVSKRGAGLRTRVLPLGLVQLQLHPATQCVSHAHTGS
jgi:hypothetical protein